LKSKNPDGTLAVVATTTSQVANLAVNNSVLKAIRWAALLLWAGAASVHGQETSSTSTGWVKYAGNPVLGGNYGTCFDVSVLREGNLYRMWFSWRPKASVALVESKDGFHWSKPVIVLQPNKASGWEEDVNRPVVIQNEGVYRMWYTGQAGGRSAIGYATSVDGVAWTRLCAKPVLSADCAWEKGAAMCPDVMFDSSAKLYKMWYSAGEQYEPDAIGYATSPDGMVWTKRGDNPVFKPDRAIPWERAKVTACQVVQDRNWYLMFYIGFRDTDHAQIGVARSRDGVTDWQRLAANPIISPGAGQWDADACYKPCALFDGEKWLLWYNGRREHTEQIGVAIHKGRDFEFGHE
jgi:beta-1,2-mannobiose phosphorylase / 1,2-beta-oligomannan phosphorylase